MKLWSCASLRWIAKIYVCRVVFSYICKIWNFLKFTYTHYKDNETLRACTQITFSSYTFLRITPKKLCIVLVIFIFCVVLSLNFRYDIFQIDFAHIYTHVFYIFMYLYCLLMYTFGTVIYILHTSICKCAQWTNRKVSYVYNIYTYTLYVLSFSGYVQL